MLGFGAVAALSLALLWRRSRRRGRIGRKASVVLRSVYTLVLGLGGWFIGVLVVLIAFPTVPLDDVLLAVLSIGIPVGLGVYLAWVDRGSPAWRAGLWAAMAGALAGAWLGYHAGTGLLAVITTILGAAVGANLVLIVLDVVRDPAAAQVSEPAQPALTAAG